MGINLGIKKWGFSSIVLFWCPSTFDNQLLTYEVLIFAAAQHSSLNGNAARKRKGGSVGVVCKSRWWVCPALPRLCHETAERELRQKENERMAPDIKSTADDPSGASHPLVQSSSGQRCSSTSSVDKAHGTRCANSSSRVIIRITTF